MSLDKINMQYEVEKLKAKLNLCSNIASNIDSKLLDLEVNGTPGLKDIRNELRDLVDFMNSSKN